MGCLTSKQILFSNHNPDPGISNGILPVKDTDNCKSLQDQLEV